LTRLSTLAGFLSLLYFVPALFLFILLMVCFTGSVVCPAGVYALALSPILAWLEWPWGKIVPVGMFDGPMWGKVFVLSSILVNAAVIFATARAVEWFADGRFERPRAYARRVLMWLGIRKDRLISRPPKPATVAVAIYLVPALLLWIGWQICSGWTWVCSAPWLESLAGPWARWMGWMLTGSNASVEGVFGPFGVRLFVLAALALNSTLIFLVVRWYQRIFTTWRHDPPRLVGITIALIYAIPALFLYIDALRCEGMLCDLGVILAALPWSLADIAQSREGGRFIVLVMLALNTVLLYVVSATACRLARLLLVHRRATN
jgi:hypothetical protein